MPSKKSKASQSDEISSAGRLDHNSPGKITAREMPFIHRRLIGKIGHSKAERVMEQLEANMDTDGAFGSKNVSAKEIDQLMRVLQKSDYNDLNKSELDKTLKILKDYE